MIARTALIFASICSVSAAAVRSGKASADWITASETAEPGKPVQTAIRLQVDAPWHTYWQNPGEGGMKISVNWDLPPGWTAGELEHPAPKRFMTGELAGFGYEGTVVFPVRLTAPADFSGKAKLKGKLSWLTCNDAQCIPGDAELELALVAGTAVPTADAKLIAEALKKIPRPSPEILLSVAEQSKTLILTLTGSPPFQPGDYEVFPAPGEIVDAAAKFTFVSEGNGWKAEVPKSEYFESPLKELTLVLSGKNGQSPLAIEWKAVPKLE